MLFILGFMPFGKLELDTIEQTIPFPSVDAFGIDRMLPKDQPEFLAWHQQASNEFRTAPYNIIDQLYKYNLSDVEVNSNFLFAYNH